MREDAFVKELGGTSGVGARYRATIMNVHLMAALVEQSLSWNDGLSANLGQIA